MNVATRTEPFTIRRMTIDDIPSVLAIDRLSFPIPWSERTYRFELLENENGQLLVAEHTEQGQEHVVGHVGYWTILDEVHISTLAVHPDFRNLGLGRTLLRKALQQAARAGASMATLEVRASNAVAIQLYAQEGFKVVGRRQRYYRDNNEDALLMTLEPIQIEDSEQDGGVS